MRRSMIAIQRRRNARLFAGRDYGGAPHGCSTKRWSARERAQWRAPAI